MFKTNYYYLIKNNIFFLTNNCLRKKEKNFWLKRILLMKYLDSEILFKILHIYLKLISKLDKIGL